MWKSSTCCLSEPRRSLLRFDCQRISKPLFNQRAQNRWETISTFLEQWMYVYEHLMVRVIESDLFLFVNILFYLFVFVFVVVFLCHHICICVCVNVNVCECKSEVKKTQDNVVVVVVVVKWSEEKSLRKRQDKVNHSSFFPTQLNSTQHTSTSSQLTYSLTHTLKQTKKERKKDLYCFATKTKTFVLLFNKHSSFFLSSQHSSISLQQAHFHCFSKSTTSLSSQRNSSQLKHLYSFPTKTHVLSDWDADWDWDAESQSPLLLKQTDRQRDRETIKQRWEGDAEVKVETV